MKISGLGCLVAALAIATVAFAKLSAPSGILGKVEGVFDFCAQADPQSAEKYQEKKKESVKDATAEELAEARASQEYKDAYQSTTDELSKEPKDEVRKSCSSTLKGN